MNVNGKYLKDESGNVFSPIVSTDTIYRTDTQTGTNCIPRVYQVTSSESKLICIFDNESIEDWYLIKIYGNIKRKLASGQEDSKAIYFTTNHSSTYVQTTYAMDRRFKDNTWSTYYRATTESSRLYIGDIPNLGNSTYIELSISRYSVSSLWLTYNCILQNMTGDSTTGYYSNCGGQFQITDTSYFTLTEIELYQHINTLEGTLTCIIY